MGREGNTAANIVHVLEKANFSSLTATTNPPKRELTVRKSLFAQEKRVRLIDSKLAREALGIKPKSIFSFLQRGHT